MLSRKFAATCSGTLCLQRTQFFKFSEISLRAFSSNGPKPGKGSNTRDATQPRPLRGLIAGGGIGGLAAAICLRKAGIEALLFEAATAFERNAGVGLVLTNNAVNACDRIGVGEEVRARGARIEEVQFYDFDGGLLSKHDFVKYEHAFGAPSVGISREALQDILLQALKKACGTNSLDGILNFNSRFMGALKIEPQADYPVVADFGRSTARGDFLIGADGLHSSVRRVVFPDEQPPSHAGWAMWTGIANVNDPSTAGKIVNMVSNHGGRVFLSIDIGNGRRYWGLSQAVEPTSFLVTPPKRYVPPPPNPVPWHKRAGRAEDKPAQEGPFIERATSTLPPGLNTPADRKAYLLRHLTTLPQQHAIERITQTVQNTDDKQLLYLDVFDRGPPQNWADGHIALLGDGAHATQPTSGQGAGLSIEDAEVLADALSRTGRFLGNNDAVTLLLMACEDIPTALRIYEERRESRCKVVVSWGQRLGRLYTTTNPLLLFMRNFLIRHIPHSVALRQMAWIYGYKPPSLRHDHQFDLNRFNE